MVAAEYDWVPGAFSIIRAEALRKRACSIRNSSSTPRRSICAGVSSDAGYKIWYWPDIVVTHIGGESSRQVKSLEMSIAGAQLVLWRMRSTLLYYRKHHGSARGAQKMLEIGLYRLVVLRNNSAATAAAGAGARNIASSSR